MSASARSGTLKGLLSTLWFASAAQLGLLFLMNEASLLRVGLLVFSGVCLLASGGAFTVVYMDGRERP